MNARNETSTSLPAPLGSARSSPGAEPAAGAAYVAQSLGQGGERRGLKGGAPVLAAAHSAYLRTQWSGEDDRRPAAGLLKRADL